MKYIDVHSHIHDKAFDSKVEIDGFNTDRDLLISALKENDIYTITIGTDYDTSLAAKKLAEENENVYYTIGVHPHDDVTAIFDENKFKDLLGTKCLAIGECGLDYFRLAEDKEKGIIENMDREVDRQQQLFTKQINFASENNLPLMLHGRPSVKNEIDNADGMDAYHDMIFILKNIKEKLEIEKREILRGNVHFFVGNIEIANKFMELGFDFSLGGVLTISHDYDEMVKHIPIERIHAETDSPYVVPRDSEGKRVSKINSPLNIEVIINKIAEIKNISAADLNSQLLLNAERLFGI